MDAQLDTEVGNPPTWDFFLILGEDGADYVPLITGLQEEAQNAAVAAVLFLGSIPQLPDTGVDHLGFLTSTTTFGQLDSQIRIALRNAGRSDYLPDYDIVNNQLVVKALKGG